MDVQKWRKRRAKQFSEEVWAQHRPHLEDLYIRQDKKLKDVIITMKEEYGFEATKRQYTYRYKSWNCYKNESNRQLQQARAGGGMLLSSDDGHSSIPAIVATASPPSLPPYNISGSSSLPEIPAFAELDYLFSDAEPRASPDVDIGAAMDVPRADHTIAPACSMTAEPMEAHQPGLAYPTRSVAPMLVLSVSQVAEGGDASTRDDLINMVTLADYLRGTKLYPQAFNLYKIVQEQASLPGSTVTQEFVVRVIATMASCASSEIDFRHIESVRVNLLDKMEHYRHLSTVEMCLIRSHLGRLSLDHGDIYSAANHCTRALESYQIRRDYMSASGPNTTMVTNLKRVLKRLGNFDLAESYGHEYRRNLDGKSRDLTDSVLNELVVWAAGIIRDGSLSTLCQNTKHDLWTNAPSKEARIDFEWRLLFCLLWRLSISSVASTERTVLLPHCGGLLRQLQSLCGLDPVASLAALAVMIMDRNDDEVGSRSKSSMPDRALARALYLPKNYTAVKNIHGVGGGDGTLMRAFLTAHNDAQTVITSSLTSERYESSIQSFFCGFVEANYRLDLSDRACQLLKITAECQQQYYCPTMISTPHSSMSGYASLISLSRNSQIHSYEPGDAHYPASEQWENMQALADLILP